LGELEEMQYEAYKSARLSNEMAKLVNDRIILRNDFAPSMKLLLYDSRLHLFPGKLRSRWVGPFVVTHAFPHGAVEIHNPATGAKEKVNGQRLKQFLKYTIEEDVECLMLHEPPHNY